MLNFFCCCLPHSINDVIEAENKATSQPSPSTRNQQLTEIVLDTFKKEQVEPRFPDATSSEVKMPYPITPSHFGQNQLTFAKIKPLSFFLSPSDDDKLKSLNEWLENPITDNSYDDLQLLREAKRQFKSLSKRIESDPHKNLSQIEALNKAKIAFENKSNALLELDDVKKHVALEKCIAIKKGFQSRSTLVTSRQIQAFISDLFPTKNKEEITDISKTLARQINVIMENPANYLGKNLQLKAYEKSYPFYSFENQRTKHLALNFFCWLELSQGGDHIELFIAPNLPPIGHGKSKLVSIGFSIEFPFKLEPLPKKLRFPHGPDILIYERPGKCKFKALIEARKDDPDDFYTLEPEKLEKNNRERIEKEIRHLNFFHSLLPNTPIISPIKKTKPLVDGTTGKTYFSQDLYFGDLNTLNKLSKIHLDFTENGAIKKTSVNDVLKVIMDVAKNLTDIHQIDSVHHDVKPQNIFIDLSDDKKKLIGVLGDYGLSQNVGVQSIITEDLYPYWDALANYGQVTKFSDVYGLTKTLAYSILPDFDKTLPSILILKQGQLDYLLKAFKKIYPTASSPKKCDDLSKILTFYERTVTENDTEKAPDIINQLRAIKGSLELVVEIMLINQKLYNHFRISPSLVWEFIRKDQNLYYKAKQNDCLNAEIEKFFNLPGNLFFNEIASKISKWTKLSAVEKILRAKELIADSKTLDSSDKRELEQIIKRLEIRHFALEYIGSTPFEELEKRPLYYVLMQPTVITNEASIYKYLCREIEIVLRHEPLFRRFAHGTKADIESKAWRAELTQFLRKTLKDTNENKSLKNEAEALLNKILLLEKTIDFVLEIRNVYVKQAKEVMKNAMSMETFLSRLKAISQTLIPMSDLEEKKQ